MKYSFLLILVLTCIKGSAQKITFTESTEIVKDYYHIMVSASTGNYIDIQYTSPRTTFSDDRDEKNAIATVYDHQLKLLYSKPIEAVKGKKFIISWSCGGKNYMLFGDNKKEVLSSFELNDDGSARLIDDSVIPGEEGFTSFRLDFSPDSSRAFIICRYAGYSFNKGKKQVLSRGVIMDKQMKVLSKFSYKDDQIENDIFRRNYAINNEGILNIITTIAASGKGSNRAYTQILTQFNDKGKKTSEPLIGFPEGEFGSTEWVANKDNLIFTALKTKEKDAKYSSVVRGIYSLQQKQVTDIKTSDLPDEDIPQDAYLKDSYTLKDHGRLMVWQQSAFQNVGNGRDIRDRVWSGNIYVVRLNEAGELVWQTVIYKNQWEFVRWKHSGAVVFMDDKEELNIFFRDTHSNNMVKPITTIKVVLPDGANQAMACVHVTKDGKATKQFIDVKEGGAVPVIDDAYAENMKSIICTLYEWGNGARSRYHIGRFTIE